MTFVLSLAAACFLAYVGARWLDDYEDELDHRPYDWSTEDEAASAARREDS